MNQDRQPMGGVLVGHVRMFNRQEAGEYLGVNPETVRRAWVKGQLAGTKDRLRNGSPLLFTKQALDDFRASRQEVREVAPADH